MVLGVGAAETFHIHFFCNFAYTIMDFSGCSSVMEDGLYPASYSYIDNFTPNPYSSMEIAESWKHVVKKFVITLFTLSDSCNWSFFM